MKFLRWQRYVFLLLAAMAFTPFTKALNEYGRWLKFHDLKDESFKIAGIEKQINFNWQPYTLAPEVRPLYSSFFFYSPDSSYFIDLDSYDVILEKDSGGNLTYSIGDPDQKIQLVKPDGTSSTLFFTGTDGFVESAIWRNKYLFELFGFRLNEGKYTPTVWKYDLEKNSVKEFQTALPLQVKPKNYSTEVRFRTMKEKK